MRARWSVHPAGGEQYVKDQERRQPPDQCQDAVDRHRVDRPVRSRAPQHGRAVQSGGKVEEPGDRRNRETDAENPHGPNGPSDGRDQDGVAHHGRELRAAAVGVAEPAFQPFIEDRDGNEHADEGDRQERAPKDEEEDEINGVRGVVTNRAPTGRREGGPGRQRQSAPQKQKQCQQPNRGRRSTRQRRRPAQVDAVIVAQTGNGAAEPLAPVAQAVHPAERLASMSCDHGQYRGHECEAEQAVVEVRGGKAASRDFQTGQEPAKAKREPPARGKNPATSGEHRRKQLHEDISPQSRANANCLRDPRIRRET